jgi:hypothetical protein
MSWANASRNQQAAQIPSSENQPVESGRHYAGNPGSTKKIREVGIFIDSFGELNDLVLFL